MYPEEELEDSVEFIDQITRKTFKSDLTYQIDLLSFLTEMFNHIRRESDSDFQYPKLGECIGFIIGRLNPYYLSSFKVPEAQVRLLAAVLCLSGKETFLKRFDEIIYLILIRIREKSFSNDAIKSVIELLSSYYYRYPDAWATLLERSESIFKQIFPIGRKNVLGCEEKVEGIVELLQIVSKKLPRFCLNEIIKKLIKQCGSALNGPIDNFPWDRANIAMQTFLYLCASLQIKSKNNKFNFFDKNLKWRIGFCKAKIGDLEVEPVFKEISELLKNILAKITKQSWISFSNAFVFDTGKIKLISFIQMVVIKYLNLVDSVTILRLIESNNEELNEIVKISWEQKKSEARDQDELNYFAKEELIHLIGNMIFGQSFKLKVDYNSQSVLASDIDKLVFEFFTEAFDRNRKSVPTPPDYLKESHVLRGGVFFLLESLSAWSQTKLLSDSSVKLLDQSEIDLFGRTVDVYFRLLSKYETLVKEVYLDKQSDRNIILRSWSNLVGAFKRNARETADFLVSILGYSDERLRLRIIESFKYLPENRISEFMKLFEQFRLAVSEDFVNLRPIKKSRRSEKSKIEITRLYKNVLCSWNWNFQEGINVISNLTPLKMILRHVVELYYFIIKSEIDDFIWSLRREFVGILKEYVKIINEMPTGMRKSFLPLKFHLEVWLTVEDWHKTMKEKFDLQEMEELFVNFSFNLLAAVSAVDNENLSSFIQNLLIKISTATNSNENDEFDNLQVNYIYNLLKSSINEEKIQEIFQIFVKWIGNGNDPKGNFQKGIQKVFNELKEDQMINLYGPALDLFKLLSDDSSFDCNLESSLLSSPDVISISDLKGVLEMISSVSDAKLQRRILFKLKVPLAALAPFIDYKILENLLSLSEKLIETFPNSLCALWQVLVNDSEKLKMNLGIIVHFLQICLQKESEKKLKVVKFVYDAIEKIDQEATLATLMRYAHPFSGTQKTLYITPLKATFMILEDLKRSNNDYKYRSDSVALRVLFIISLSIKEHNDEIYNIDQSEVDLIANELLIWAVQCPDRNISLSAWKQLKRLSHSVSEAFLTTLLLPTKRFLQHLVCPATLKYFDPKLVEEIFGFFFEVLEGNSNLSKTIIKQIYLDFIPQLSTVDENVFEACCFVLKNCLEFEEVWEWFQSEDKYENSINANEDDYENIIISNEDMSQENQMQVCIDKLSVIPSTCIHYELTKRVRARVSNVTFELLFLMLSRETRANANFKTTLIENSKSYSSLSKIERYFCYLFAILPFIFKYFDENLCISQQSHKYQGQIQNNELLFHLYFEYMVLLIEATDKIIVHENSLDENGQLCLLELREFLISIEKRKKRKRIDFYKTLAEILSNSTIEIYTTELILNCEFLVPAESEVNEEEEANSYDEFVVYYFDCIRMIYSKNGNVLSSKYSNSPWRLANKLASSVKEEDDQENYLPLEIRQRVIDFLIK